MIARRYENCFHVTLLIITQTESDPSASRNVIVGPNTVPMRARRLETTPVFFRAPDTHAPP